MMKGNLPTNQFFVLSVSLRINVEVKMCSTRPQTSSCGSACMYVDLEGNSARTLPTDRHVELGPRLA